MKRLNLDKLKNHFTYSWWKYLIVLVVGLFGMDLLYTVTEPRVPDDQRIEVIVCGTSLEQDFNVYLKSVCAEKMTDILETEVTVTPDDTDALQYLTVRIATQGGDLYLLPKDKFVNMTENGALLPLETDQELMSILSDFNPDDFVWGNEPNSRDMHIYGISVRYLSGLDPYFLMNDGYLCVLRYGKNVENAQKFLHIIAEDMKTPIQ